MAEGAVCVLAECLEHPGVADALAAHLVEPLAATGASPLLVHFGGLSASACASCLFVCFAPGAGASRPAVSRRVRRCLDAALVPAFPMEWDEACIRQSRFELLSGFSRFALVRVTPTGELEARADALAPRRAAGCDPAALEGLHVADAFFFARADGLHAATAEAVARRVGGAGDFWLERRAHSALPLVTVFRLRARGGPHAECGVASARALLGVSRRVRAAARGVLAAAEALQREREAAGVEAFRRALLDPLGGGGGSLFPALPRATPLAALLPAGEASRSLADRALMRRLSLMLEWQERAAPVLVLGLAQWAALARPTVAEPTFALRCDVAHGADAELLFVLGSLLERHRAVATINVHVYGGAEGGERALERWAEACGPRFLAQLGGVRYALCTLELPAVAAAAIGEVELALTRRMPQLLGSGGRPPVGLAVRMVEEFPAHFVAMAHWGRLEC